jgi:DNA-binding CsgD family transcriptional regulator
MRESLNLGRGPDELISAIYDGVAKDDNWTSALTLLCSSLDLNGTGLRISQKGRNPHEYVFAAGPNVKTGSLAEWESLNGSELLPEDLAFGEVKLFDWNNVQGNSRVADLARRYDMGIMLVMCVDRIGRTDYILNASRPRGVATFDEDEIAFFTLIGQHFSRAISLRRQVLRAKVVQEFQAEALDRLGIAGILVDRDGGELLLNGTARRFIDTHDGIKSIAGRLHAVDDGVDRTFQAAIRSALAAPNATYTNAMRLPRQNGGPDLSVVINGRSSVSILSSRVESMALLFIRDPDVASAADTAVLQQLFSFTPAEARVAIGLAKGMSLDAIESQLNIRHNTARSHLRSMFVKTDVTRQAELIYLLSNCVTPLGRRLNDKQHSN